jgi:hypothetical protein
MQVFIVRPFGIKQVVKKNSAASGNHKLVSFDFDRIERELIMPTLDALQLNGGTTGKIFESGEIREDMFSLLLLADVVIADISIHNANVFYELGIRHALKNKTTVLIKCPGFDETPFDILGFRFVAYDKDNPAEAIPLLISNMQDSMLSSRIDSPVFFTMPQLDMQDTEKFFIVPSDFIEETSIAIRAKEPGKLALLASEAEYFPWKIPARRIIGEALVNLEAYDYAKEVWEKIKENNSRDKQTNINLATIYQRLSEQESAVNLSNAGLLLSKSDFAIENLFDHHASSGKELSSIYALKGRNLKIRWVNEVKSSAPDKMSETALQSAYLQMAYENYEKGYFENLNHFHSGINALGFLTILLALAERHPEVWLQSFETEEEAIEKLNKYKDKHEQLTICIKLAICIAKEKMTDEEEAQNWLNITEADFAFLTSSRTSRVSLLYRRALQNASQLQIETALRQVRMFEMLQIKPENIQAALNAFPDLQPLVKTKRHYLLFTGHMIDKPDRPSPRFPAEKENAVREKIKQAIQEEIQNTGTELIGIAGAACGADIIFHEVCEELNIPTKLFLALPREQFIIASVAFAGYSWIDRFNRLFLSLPVFVMANSAVLPKWLNKRPDYNIWKRNNLWELHAALSNGGIHMTLLALWDRKGGDGLGGTENMVNEARMKGARIIILDMINI